MFECTEAWISISSFLLLRTLVPKFTVSRVIELNLMHTENYANEVGRGCKLLENVLEGVIA